MPPRFGLLTLSLMLAAATSSAQPSIVDAAFVLHQSAIIVKVVANDRDTLQLLLDTGWGPLEHPTP
jgi:hypothetical protein